MNRSRVRFVVRCRGRGEAGGAPSGCEGPCRGPRSQHEHRAAFSTAASRRGAARIPARAWHLGHWDSRAWRRRPASEGARRFRPPPRVPLGRTRRDHRRRRLRRLSPAKLRRRMGDDRFKSTLPLSARTAGPSSARRLAPAHRTPRTKSAPGGGTLSPCRSLNFDALPGSEDESRTGSGQSRSPNRYCAGSPRWRQSFRSPALGSTLPREDRSFE
jgi:hypothetical protein